MEKKDSAKIENPRPPVVAVVGHVDHGKTTLLDFIRKSNVVAGEVGGITQAIGAYEIEHEGKKITFIDTPGHSAFSAMRARGTNIADIGVLVVSAEEGVKPQTKEAIEVLVKSETPYVVAITKIDVPNADVEKIKGELLSENVLLEGLGGDVSWQAVSGKTGEGVDELLGLIALLGEVSGLSENPKEDTSGFILESKKDKGRGNVAFAILKNGTLRQGDDIVTQTVSGKVKILENFLGERTKELNPSAPAVIGGFEELPQAGEEFWAGKVNLEVMGVSGEGMEDVSEVVGIVSEALDESGETEGEGEKLKAVLKADTAGTLEALKAVLQDKVAITMFAVGEVLDSDVQFAKSTGSVILGFNVSVGKPAERLAEVHGIKIVTSNIIYKLIEAAESLEQTRKDEETGGRLEVLKVFSGTQNKQTIGGKVVEGKLKSGARFEIVRAEEVVGKGKIVNLQQDKQDTKELTTGTEGGLVVAAEAKIEGGDQIVVE